MNSILRVIILSFLSINFTLQMVPGLNDVVVEIEVETESEIEDVVKEEFIKNRINNKSLDQLLSRRASYIDPLSNYSDPVLSKSKKPPRV